jgi:hypothetical protein
MEGIFVHALTRSGSFAPPPGVPGQPFGEHSHLIGDRADARPDRRRMTGYGLGVERWDVGCGTATAAADRPAAYHRTTVRPGAHDITVMVAIQDPAPPTARAPRSKPSPPRSVATDRRGRHRDTSVEMDVAVVR